MNLRVLYNQPYITWENSEIGNYHREELEEFFIEGDPVIGKSGWYYDKDTNDCWYEVYGRSWRKKRDPEQDVKQHKFEIAILSYGERTMSNNERAGLKALMKSPNVPAKVKKFAQNRLYIDFAFWSSRNCHREAKMSRRRILGY